MTLAPMDENEGYFSLVDPIWDAISIYDGPEEFLRQFNATLVPARNLFAAHWCQSEVCNGGFDQFFSNSTGVLAPEAAQAYEVIGMPQVATLVREAMAWFGPAYPREREERQEKLVVCEHDQTHDWNPFEKLDDKFFELIKSENSGFEQAADAYAAQHRG